MHTPTENTLLIMQLLVEIWRCKPSCSPEPKCLLYCNYYVTLATISLGNQDIEILFLFVCLFFKMGFSVYLGCPKTQYADQVGLKLIEIPLPLLPENWNKGMHHSINSIFITITTRYKEKLDFF